MAELADALDLGSSGPSPWGFESPLSHCRCRTAGANRHRRRQGRGEQRFSGRFSVDASGTDAVPVLQALGLAKRSESRWLLDHVDCSLWAGQRVSLTGPSGSGKTLLLRSLVLLEPDVEGTLLWHGRPLEPDQVPQFRSRVIYLPQKPFLAPGSVWENLRLPLRFAAHRQRQLDRRRAEELFEHLGRSPQWLDQDSSHLSGGEAQLVALVRALLLEPEVLLLDEPTAAMDPRSARAASELVFGWQQQDPRRCYLWVTHQRSLASAVGGEQWEMLSGRLNTQRSDYPAPASSAPPSSPEQVSQGDG